MALIASGCYPDIEIMEATQLLGDAGAVVLARDLLSHNTGDNDERNDIRPTVHYRMARRTLGALARSGER